MAALGLLRLLLVLRGQLGQAGQSFVVAAIPCRARRHHFLVFRRWLHRLVERLVGFALLSHQHGITPDIGGQGATGYAAGGRGIVIARPGGADIVGGETHEPGVMAVLGGAGLPAASRPCSEA